MPFVPNTPESLSTLLSRADSKSPFPTCCGVSDVGKPCTSKLTPSKSGQSASGVIAIVGGRNAFYCKRHKDQSQHVALRHTASFAQERELLGRGSMDSLIEQIELLAAGEKPGEVTATTTAKSRTKIISPEDDPFISPPKFAGPPGPPTSHRREERRQQQKAEKKHSFWSKLCCWGIEDPKEDSYPRPKKDEAELRAAASGVVEYGFTGNGGKAHRRGKSNTHVDSEFTPPTPQLPMMYPGPSGRVSQEQHNTSTAATSRVAAAGKGIAPNSLYPDLSSRVNQEQRNASTAAKSRVVAAGKGIAPNAPNRPPISDFGGRRNEGNPLIPPTLTEKTAQLLGKLLGEPFSEKDEPGYIYVFWMSDSPISPQPTPASTPNGTPKKSNGRSHQKSAPDAWEKMVKNVESEQQGQRIMLKIGRTNNVQRRLHEWSTTCGYNLSLVRYYPHISASSPGPATPNATTRDLDREIGKKVPNSHRIERLIHLELGDNPENRPKIECPKCKRTHKEWFSVPATRAGLIGVDEVVKKWIEYGERSATQAPDIPKATPTKAAVGPPKKGDIPKSASKRPTLQSTPAVTDVKAAAKKSSSPSRKANGSTGNTKTDNPPSNSTKTTSSRNAKTPSPGKSARPRTPSRPPSSRGKASSAPKTTPPPQPPSSVDSSKRKKRPSEGRWKLYDENEGSEEYRPGDEVE